MSETGTQADRRRLNALTGPDGSVTVPPRLTPWVRSLIADALRDIRRAGRGGNLAADVLDLLDDLSTAAASGNGSQKTPDETIEVDRILTCAQAAEELECTERAVRGALQDGRLHGLKLGPRHWTIRATDLDNYRHGRNPPPGFTGRT